VTGHDYRLCCERDRTRCYVQTHHDPQVPRRYSIRPRTSPLASRAHTGTPLSQGLVMRVFRTGDARWPRFEQPPGRAPWPAGHAVDTADRTTALRVSAKPPAHSTALAWNHPYHSTTPTLRSNRPLATSLHLTRCYSIAADALSRSIPAPWPAVVRKLGASRNSALVQLQK
jgi:hypothetical protein